jgi:hypothetical protein
MKTFQLIVLLHRLHTCTILSRVDSSGEVAEDILETSPFKFDCQS